MKTTIKQLNCSWKKFCRCTQGATAIEYTLIAAFIAVGSIAAFTSFGDELSDMWNNISNTMAESNKKAGG